jgi:hypothetical protein
MANMQERIAKLGKMFAGLNIGNDNNGKQFIYLELVFPQGWGVTSLIKEKFGVNVVKNDSGTGYYFWAPIETGFDSVFDAADFNIKANQEAQEKKDFLAEKMKELQKLVLEEDMSVLKTLEFKVKRKKAPTTKKKVEEVKEQETQEDGADTQE